MAKETGDSKTPSMGSIERMEIRPSENGGFTVMHHMKPKMMKDRHSHAGMSMGMTEPQTHVFSDGHEMLAHVANHLNVKEMHEEESDEKDNDDGVGEDGEYD